MAPETNKCRRAFLLSGFVLVLCGLVRIGPVQSQTLDLDTVATTPPPAPATPIPLGGLDLDSDKAAPTAPSPAVAATPHGNVQDGLKPGAPPAATDTGSSLNLATTTDNPQPAASAPSEPVGLDHPTVINTARLKAGETTVTLYGIEGLEGPMAQGLQGFLETTDHHLNCQAESSAGFVCLLSDGTDLAQVALVNGAARTKDDAPESYREQEAAAQSARRGIWANLPPPPVVAKHPVVQDTATLIADNQAFVLDGLQGLGQPYASQLQGYIAASGDSVTCNPKGIVGSYICVMHDGTDLAKVVLVNGAAVVSPDAPDSYRLQQADALNNHRGIWVNPPADLLIATVADQYAAEYVLVSGDDGFDGVAYIGGEPVAVIDGVSEFLIYSDGLGWGYYDHDHRWRDAPDRYRRHMDHFHEHGRGLRGYGRDAELRRDAVMHRQALAGHPGEFGHPGELGHPGAPTSNGVHPAGVASAGHTGAAPTGTPHPGAAAPAGHPGAGQTPGVQHQAAATPAAAGHPGATPASAFARPSPAASAGGFHPAAAPAAHAAAPAAHASASPPPPKKK